MSTVIPVIDFLPCEIKKPQCDYSALKKTGTEIVNAFQTVGFVYLKNHGITDEEEDQIFKISEDFFALPNDAKRKYLKPKSSNHGWMELDRESLNPTRPADLKEAFNYTPKSEIQLWPSEELPDFNVVYTHFWELCTRLTHRVLECLAHGLDIDAKQFVDTHVQLGKKNNASTLRSIWYPGVKQSSDLVPGQVRCGEHTDYGSVTLLFQDDVGGLQVQNVNGEYTDLPPIPGTVIVNLGGLMQRWTADRLIAAPHRVLLPKDEDQRRKTRRSIAFFAQPDDEVSIECLDGSNKYQPINALDYLIMRFNETYQDLKTASD